MIMEMFFSILEKQKTFKVYEVEDNKVVSGEVIGSNGTGHGAWPDFWQNRGLMY